MALTSSKALPLGSKAQAFRLSDANGKNLSLQELQGASGTLIIFMCNHCPFVKHIAPALARLTQIWQGQGIATIGINSNDAESYPDDSPEKMLIEAKQWGYTFPYLVDASQEVAQAYSAVCTPDIYLFDGDLKLYYHGEFDASRPNKGEADGSSLQAAITSLLEAQPAPASQTPSVGCNIKWK